MKPTIIKFNNRKTVDKVFLNKSKLKDLNSLNIEISGITGDSKIFIRPSLCPYYKHLQYNCRILKRHDLIKFVATGDDGIIKIKTHDDRYVKITHESDLFERFKLFTHFKKYELFKST